MAQRLGAQAAERLNVERTAAAVLERLRAEPASDARWSWMQPTWLRIAAAVLIVMGGAAVASRLPRGSGFGRDGVSSAHGAHLVADDLNDLSPEQLRDVLATFDELVSGDSVAVPEGSTDLRELDARQLRAVLRSLEG